MLRLQSFGLRGPFTIFVIGSLLMLSACAGLTVEPIGTDLEKDCTARGFRYYQSAPFLFVRSDGKGGLTAEIKYLPDTRQKMSARPFAYASSNETTLKFEGGMLTQASVTVDETVVVNAALDALSKVLAASAKAAMDAPTVGAQAAVPVPYLFRITLQGNTIELKGGPAMDKDGKPMIIYATLIKQGE